MIRNRSDGWTDKELEKLERRISREYGKAYKEVRKTYDKYLKSFDERAKQYKAQLESGAVALPEGETVEKHYAKWLLNQIGRGKRWEQLKTDMAKRVVESNKVAMSYVKDCTPTIYSLNANYAAYQIESAYNAIGKTAKDKQIKDSRIGVSFNLYDEQTVKRLIEKDRQLLPNPKVDIPKAIAWNRRKMQSELIAGVLRGDSIAHMADRFEHVVGMDRDAAIRNARTAVTGAQNAGRQDSYERAEAMGIIMEKEWISTQDGRTRESHELLNGVRVAQDEEFPNGLMYPGDPSGDPSEVYNCRCTMRAVISGTASAEVITGNTVESYEDWYRRKEEERENGD